MLYLQNISYTHPNKGLLFEHINLTVNNQEKIALIGNNGSGKSTLLKIIARYLSPLDGELSLAAEPYYVPQIFGQFNHLTVAQALKVENKIEALTQILNGNVTEENYAILNDDWTIEERCTHALNHWHLKELNLSQKMETLSGGQKARVLLAGIYIHRPELVLLDEPSNHLDEAGRQLLCSFIQSTKSTLIIVSHDRELLNLLDKICELGNTGISVYGGNYDFYTEQKEIEHNSLNQDVISKEKALRKAKEKEKETLERQQKLDSRGKGKQLEAGVSRIMMNTLRNKAENSTSKMKGMHAEKIDGIANDLRELRSALPDIDQMKFGFNNSAAHKGKILFKATEIDFTYDGHPLWIDKLSFQIASGDRLALKGANGSGKTTLINIILGNLTPTIGTIYTAKSKAVYIDQDYSLINNELKVYEMAQQFNIDALKEHEVKIKLNRFLFTKDDWDKYCGMLSGGERMRLLLCCLTMSRQSPNIIILDEPTNNLDLQNIAILTSAVNEYQGTLVVVSHDTYFLEQININRSLTLV
ncbi:ribosomal protection-like ABC-F family protein [Pedobacter sp. PWIIR3]